MAVKRHEDWAERRLHDFLVERAETAFAWGTHDCALFAADGVLAMTGVDIAADFRGKYSTERGAFAQIRRVCGGSTVEAAAAHCARRHNLPQWRFPAMAQRGDLVVVTDAGRLIAGLIHLSGRFVVCAGEEGLRQIPLERVVRAWHVGPHCGSHLHEGDSIVEGN